MATKKASKPKLTAPQRAWVRALRSGKFKWGKNALQSKSGFCCLGVACIVAEKHDVIVSRDGDRLEGENLNHQRAVMDWLGLAGTDGEFEDANRIVQSLAEKNDTALRNPFAKIADLIESKPAGLFTN